MRSFSCNTGRSSAWARSSSRPHIPGSGLPAQSSACPTPPPVALFIKVFDKSREAFCSCFPSMACDERCVSSLSLHSQVLCPSVRHFPSPVTEIFLPILRSFCGIYSISTCDNHLARRMPTCAVVTIVFAHCSVQHGTYSP